MTNGATLRSKGRLAAALANLCEVRVGNLAGEKVSRDCGTALGAATLRIDDPSPARWLGDPGKRGGDA